MSKLYDVAILGGGIVGRTLALLLARERLRVALVERTPAAGDAPDIRAYALNAASRALLTAVRGWPTEPDAVTPVRHMWVADADTAPDSAAVDAAAAIRFDAAAAPSAPLAWIVDVPALEATLAQAVAFQPGIERLDADQTPRPRAALTVICEGRRSATRLAEGFAYERHPYPHTAVAARLRCERPHGAVARQWFCGDSILALLPMGGEHGHTVALVWSVPHARAAELLALPPDAFAAAVQTACGAALGAMHTEGRPAGWPLELSIARPWVRPGVALAGDAAHAMHPLAGQGLNVGLGDVAELARVLREREYWRPLGDLRLLRRYERARAAPVAAMQATTDALHALFGSPDPRLALLRRWGLRAADRLEPIKHWLIQQAAGQPLTPAA
ncbi:FAD-dependent monooxygenase [Tepidimonas taiwanensis]|uniref:2-octaprenylphenol hydroxylase n=1 Tax=Tepidimonas taiwanensis TaxID=307486 RepID=A0A554XCD1_9BURK|nr:FAD-dependent monooxygenase [Tepidimonas taiwanensis]MCX7692507.1 FAD-dependent monooxygenase [Tepidimonas taiwanensis]MDM7462242.1 FAD-dependent monooxygenase [Tepidimonas taiwanensis]TSE33501.1 2-octaprenylphenol hydroxylase [Tepidimonas taiwanensis]UBQ05797.1 FAD-dependent monooxygenase [Tepidimonas taiwanensis]